MFDYLFYWPDQFTGTDEDSHVLMAARHIRLQQFSPAEGILLANLTIKPNDPEPLVLLGHLALYRRKFDSFLKYHQQLSDITGGDSLHCRFLYTQYLLQNAAREKLVQLSDFLFQDALSFQPLVLAKIAMHLHFGDVELASKTLLTLNKFYSRSLEAVRLQARISESLGDYSSALELLLPAAERFPQHLPLHIHLLDSAIKARSQDKTLPILNSILARFGIDPLVFSHLSQIRMLENRNAEALSIILKNRVFNSIIPNQESFATNVYNMYDRLGHVDWLRYSPALLTPDHSSLGLPERENLCMQAASLEMNEYQSLVLSVIADYTSPSHRLKPSIKLKSADHPSSNIRQKLRIGWISADLAYHPVGRFLLGILNGSRDPDHQHIVIDTCDHGKESTRNWFSNLDHCIVENTGKLDLNSKLDHIRSLGLDIAIDLSGWTSGHFMQGFLSRLAPLQISYLGYFASTGLQQMDYWLGDSLLFPEDMSEWHTEKILRLERCFLAWNPPSLLPEANVVLPDFKGSRTDGVRFGSFNHHRKLSDKTLICWGRILDLIPDSKLVLKSGRSCDNATSTLLATRMRKAGLDPARVIWLPRTPDPVDHLLQYSEIDIALDCFPNGGCTTTCEAIWMGVPVVSLSGLHYVSRMSTAVLNGAGMSDWCVNSIEDYIQTCINYSSNLEYLRSNRSLWRHKLLTNQLGDSASLFQSLEETFSNLSNSL